MSEEISAPVDTPDYYSKSYSWMIDYEVSHVKSEEDEVIVILEKFSRVFLGQDDTEFAWMVNPEKCPGVASGMLMVDCSASTTVTESLFNMTNVEPRAITIQLPRRVQQ
jgi:hypothetical protein